MGAYPRRPSPPDDDPSPLSQLRTQAYPQDAAMPSMRSGVTEAGTPGVARHWPRPSPGESGKFIKGTVAPALGPYDLVMVQMAEAVLRSNATTVPSLLKRLALRQVLEAFGESDATRDAFLRLMDPDGRLPADLRLMTEGATMALLRHRLDDWRLSTAELLQYFPAVSWIPRLPKAQVWRFLRSQWQDAYGASRRPADLLFAMLSQQVTPRNAADLLRHGLRLAAIGKRVQRLGLPSNERAKLQGLLRESQIAPEWLRVALLRISPHLLELFPAAPALNREVMDPFARAFGWERPEADAG